MIGRSPEFFVAYPPDQLSTRNAIGPLRGAIRASIDEGNIFVWALDPQHAGNAVP
jgi:hypothetical protein